MSGLLSAIPGLSAHETVVPVVEQSFDFRKADDLLAQLNSDIADVYPAGAIAWLLDKRVEVWNALCAGENDVDRAYLAEDMPALEKAVDLLRRMYFKAFDIYKTRPPVIEVQESFL